VVHVGDQDKEPADETRYALTDRLDGNRNSISIFSSSRYQGIGPTAGRRIRRLGKDTIRVTKDPSVKEFDEPTFAKLKGAAFKDGTIEVKVLSRLLKEAPDFARGFIGIAFRIAEDNSRFECLYLRPANARVDQQLRRNRSIQYFAYPDFKFERLRKESPGEYESYADMGLNEWIDLKIVVKGAQARLFVNNQKEPALIVNHLKHGADASGTIGLWVDVGTQAHFSNLRINGN